MVLDIFTWNFWKHLAWLGIYEQNADEISKDPFIELKIVNKRPIEIQCILPEEERNVEKIIYLMQKFDTVLMMHLKVKLVLTAFLPFYRLNG